MSQTASLNRRNRNTKKLSHQTLPESIPIQQKLIFAGIVLGIIGLLFYNLFSQGEVTLLTPATNATISASELDFRWESNKPGINYVLEVYDAEDLVIRQTTKETHYTPEDTQKTLFLPDHNYRWQVLSNPDVKQAYEVKSVFNYFKITQAFKPTKANNSDTNPQNRPYDVRETTPPPPSSPPPTNSQPYNPANEREKDPTFYEN
jgi:hypothetical protein